MKKNLKYVLAAAVLGTGAYLWWKSKQQKPKSFANLASKSKTSDCVTPLEIVQDAGGVCSTACENNQGDLIILKRPVACPAAV